MIDRILTGFIFFCLVFSFWWVLPPVEAAEPTDSVWRMNGNVLCIQPDFVVVGSSWKLHKEVKFWNEAQDIVELYVGTRPECTTLIHISTNYPADMPDWCAYTYTAAGDGSTWMDGDLSIFNEGYIYLSSRCLPIQKRQSKFIVGHEIGHAMGLPHSTGPTSIMSYEYQHWLYKGRPGPEDVAALTALFALPGETP